MGQMLHKPCPVGGPQCFRAGDKNQKWPTSAPNGYRTLAIYVASNATRGGEYHKWPTTGPSDYLTRAVMEVPRRFKAGYKFRCGPQVGPVTTQPLPSRGGGGLFWAKNGCLWPKTAQIWEGTSQLGAHALGRHR